MSLMDRPDGGWVIVNDNAFEVSFPGLTTAMLAVPGDAISDARIVAWRTESATKVVVRDEHRPLTD